MKGLTGFEVMVILCLIAVVACAVMARITSMDKTQGKIEVRELCCPLPKCEDIWTKKTHLPWNWEMSSDGNLVSDKLVNLSEHEVLRIINARRKQGYALIPSGRTETESITKVTVTLTWEKPKKQEKNN